MLAGIADGSIPCDAGRPFLECDGDLFLHVVNFLRRGKAFVPADFSRWEELHADLPFPEDATAVEQAQQKRAAAAEEERKKRLREPSR
eukprot:gene33368-24052_t